MLGESVLYTEWNCERESNSTPSLIRAASFLKSSSLTIPGGHPILVAYRDRSPTPPTTSSHAEWRHVICFRFMQLLTLDTSRFSRLVPLFLSMTPMCLSRSFIYPVVLRSTDFMAYRLKQFKCQLENCLGSFDVDLEMSWRDLEVPKSSRNKIVKSPHCHPFWHIRI